MSLFSKLFGKKETSENKVVNLSDIMHYQQIYMKGVEYGSQGNFSKAMECFQELIRLQPQGATGYEGIGMVYQEQKKYSQAIEAFQKAIELKPDRASAYTNLGNLYYMQGKQQEGITMWEKAVQLGDEKAKTNLNKYKSSSSQSNEDSVDEDKIYEVMRKIYGDNFDRREIDAARKKLGI